MAANPFNCYTAKEMQPVLRAICGSPQGDWKTCLADLAKGAEPFDVTKSTYSGRDETKGVSSIHVMELLPDFCAQLSRENCGDFGEGDKVIPCRWNPHADDEGRLEAAGPRCGLLVQASDPRDPSWKSEAWLGGMGGDYMTFPPAAPPAGERASQENKERP